MHCQILIRQLSKRQFLSIPPNNIMIANISCYTFTNVQPVTMTTVLTIYCSSDDNNSIDL